MQFRTQYERPDRDLFRTNPGREEYPTFVSDENGRPVVSGTKNRYDEIQSHRQSVELSTLLQRYEMGDETALNQRAGVYEDLVDAPSSLAEIYERFSEAEKQFYNLPDGFRELFGNSTVNYWKEVGTPEYFEKLDKFMASVGKKESDNNNNSNNNNADDKASRNGGNISE
uniref:Internal scaffolding protein n=1 Tax=Dulem virus 172 TaxID=3145649 RepID=A0AAU8AXL5_9VIRU